MHFFTSFCFLTKKKEKEVKISAVVLNKNKMRDRNLNRSNLSIFFIKHYEEVFSQIPSITVT